MTAITLTINTPKAKPVTTTINASVAKPVTQQRLELIAKVVRILTRLTLDEIRYVLSFLETGNSKHKLSQTNDVAIVLDEDPLSDEEQKELEIAALKDFFEWRQELLLNSLTASEVAKLLNAKSRQTPHDRRKNNSLIAVEDNGVWKFPSWQFDPSGPDSIIAGLPLVLKALKIPDFSKISWLTQPNPALDGLTPIEALKQGKKEEVLAEAHTVGKK